MQALAIVERESTRNIGYGVDLLELTKYTQIYN